MGKRAEPDPSQGLLFDPPAPVVKTKTSAPMRLGWRPTPEQMAAHRGRFPQFDVDVELLKFVAYWRTKGTPRVNWNPSFATWLAKSKLFDAEDRLAGKRGLPNPAAVESQT